MTRCYICDKGLDEVKLDPRDNKPTPCTECETAIQECLEGFDSNSEQEQEEGVISVLELEYDEYYEYNDTTHSNGRTDLGDTEG